MTCDCQIETNTTAVTPFRSISVNARLYKLIVGDEPRGDRCWRFAIGATSGSFEVPKVMPYETARCMAVARARRLGLDTVTVLP